MKAKLNHLQMAPRKVRLVADLVRGKEVEEAKRQLKFCKKKASVSLLKLLNSALANAEEDFEVESDFKIGKLTVDEGPTMKRQEFASRGQTNIINKRTSHIELELKPVEGEAKKKEKKTRIEEQQVETREEVSEEVEEEKQQEQPEKQKKKSQPREGRSLRDVFKRSKGNR